MSRIFKLSYWLVPILFVSLCPLALHAQEGAAQERPADKAKQKPEHHTQTVTGCLQKGNEAGEFSLTSEDGKTWVLESSSVKLDEHVGHKVSVTGSVTHESKAQEKKEGQVENANSKEEYADLRVSSLKMISKNCGK
jgi:hypothetical protein